MFFFALGQIEFIVGTLTGITTPGQSAPESNASEEALHILRSSRTESPPSDAAKCCTQNVLLGGESYPSAGDTGSVF